MLIGLHYRPTDLSMPLLELARLADERDFASLYFAEHTHVPVQRWSVVPGVGRLPDSRRELVVERPLRQASAPGLERYQRILDPYMSMAFVAATTRLRVGTCVSLVAQHDAIALAKAVATLDFLSGGRVTLGVGLGWHDEELANHGLEPHQRRPALREKVAVMRELWRNEVGSFDGELATLTPSYAWPKPTRGDLPVLLGCRARPAGFREVAAWADGWIPMDFDSVGHLEADLSRLRREWQSAGRTGDPSVVVMHDAGPDIGGGSAGVTADLAAYDALGVDEVVLEVPTDGAAQILPLLDLLARAC